MGFLVNSRSTFGIFGFFGNSHGFGQFLYYELLWQPHTDMVNSTPSIMATIYKKRQTCMSTSLPTVGWHPDSPLGAPAVFHVAPCLLVFYFVATVSNSAVRARRENMRVFWVVSGCLYLSCWSPCVLFANDIHDKPDKPDTWRPADHQLTVKKCRLAGLLVSCLLMTLMTNQTQGYQQTTS